MGGKKQNSQGNACSLILENVSEIIYFVETKDDPTRGSVKFVSPSVEEIVGYTRDEFTKNAALWVSIIHPDDVQAVQRATDEMFVTKKRVSRQYRIRHKVTGEYIWIVDKPSLVFDRNRKISGYIGVAREADRLFRESEQKFKAQVDGFPLPTYLWQLQGDQIVLVGYNVAASPITGQYVQGLLGRSARDIYPDRPDILEDFERCLSTKGTFRREVAYRFRVFGDLRASVVDYVFVPPDLIMVHIEDTTEHKRAGQELQKLARAVEQTADIVFITDRNGLIEYVNPAFEKSTGYKREEVIDKTPRILKSGEHPESFYERLWKTILEGHPFRSILINRKKDGTTFFEEKTITPLRAEDGTITHFVSTGKDVTERMKTAELLRQSEKKQRLVLSNIHEIVYSISFKEGNFFNGSVDFVNDPVVDTLGFSAEEFTMNHRLWLESIHPEDLATVQESIARLQTDKQPITCTYRVKHKRTGEYRWMEDHAVPRLATGDKKVVGIFGVARDITESKRTQDQLLFQSSMLDQVRNAAIATDLDGKITYWNKFAETLYGWRAEDVLGKQAIDLVVPAAGKTHTREIRNQVDQTGYWEGEIELQRKDGTIIPIHSTSALLKDSTGKATGRIGISIDITERKHAEEIARAYLERLQVLSKLLLDNQENERRSIARELHDEIGQTLTSLKILLEMSPNAKADIVRESFQEALGLVSDLIGRVRNLSVNLRPPILDDLGLVAAIRWHLLHRTEKMGIEVHFKAEPEEIHVSGEIATACFRVAQEALTNVLKHSKPKSVDVQVMKRGANLELAVGDDGTGFDVDSAFRRAAAGESFGLLGMQERIRLAGGTLVIRSEQGRGTEIQATFPDAFVQSSRDSEWSTER